MTNYASRVRIPSKESMNGGLSPTGNSMASIFGRPGTLSINCSPVTNEYLIPLMVTRDVGPFRVTGFRPAVESLTRIFEKVYSKDKALFDSMRTAGMTCCRAIRGVPGAYSIHSWGCAIDLFTGDSIEPLGSPLTDLGVLELYPYFHEEGWYWGAEFRRNDAMHYEVARQTVAKWHAAKWMSDYKQTVAPHINGVDKLVLNGYLFPSAKLQQGHWWAPANQVAKALQLELPSDSTQMVKVREAIPKFNHKLVKWNDLRLEKDRFYMTAYPSKAQ